MRFKKLTKWRKVKRRRVPHLPKPKAEEGRFSTTLPKQEKGVAQIFKL